MNQHDSQRAQNLLNDERGLTTVEYVILLCLIAVVGFAIWKKVGGTIKTHATNADNTLQTLSDGVEAE